MIRRRSTNERWNTVSEGKVAVLTGGTGGLGTALAGRLLARGYRLAVTYLVPDEATTFETTYDVGEDRLLLKRVNATDPDGIGPFLDDVASRFGRIDAVASLVGGWAGGRDVADTDNVRFDRMIDLNLRSAFYTARSAVPHLVKTHGSMLFVSSRAALDTPPGEAAFNIAKAGVIALAKTLASELEDSEVSVNALLPAVIDTPATRATLPYADYVDWPTPDEIAAVAEFLLGGESGVISGAAIPVYGRA
jgi:NAD(P)-dependent dehydrogenase (short-subunit alcohol dehydrogenase family)